MSYLYNNTKTGGRGEIHPTHKNVHQSLIADFVEAVFDNREPKVTGETGKIIAEIESQIYGQNLLGQRSVDR